MSTSPIPTKKLTDAQLVILSSASQEPDGLVAIADSAPPCVRKTVMALLKRSLLVETPARPTQPYWRLDGQGKAIGAKITPQGLVLLGVGAPAAASSTIEQADALAADPTAAVAAKPGTKQALIVDLLRRPAGATISDLIGVTGWLPHTTRAALTGLRRKGFVLDKTQASGGAPSYRIVPAAAASAA